MRAYFIRRILLIIPTVILASIMVFLVIRLIPGDLVDLMEAQHLMLSEMTREDIEHELGLDVPMHIQYIRWISDIILHGDLGDSLWMKTPVIREIAQRFPITLELGIMALTISLLIALPIGVYSAIRQDTWGDYIARSFSIGAIAIPSFWIGTMIIVLPSLWFGWSPPIKVIPITKDFLGNLEMFIIPAAVMGMALSGVVMRMPRTMMLEVLRKDYIRTAWAKGLRERVVVIRHALKNALIPVITIVGLQVPYLIGSAVIIEQVFGLPGIARLIWFSIIQRDYTMVSAIMLVMAVIVLLINLAVDLAYGFLDPKIRYK